MDITAEPSETQRNKCSACFKQYNRKEHLVEHMRISYHSVHEPKCGICKKHCRYFESLREHLTGESQTTKGSLPKIECARIFFVQGCNLCLTILDSPYDLMVHRRMCQLSRLDHGLVSQVSRLSLQREIETCNTRTQVPQVFSLGCKMVGGGSDGSLDMCARVCLIDEDENIFFHTYVKPQIPVTNYRYDMTGIRVEHLKEAMPLKQVRNKIQDFLCNGSPMWKIRMKEGKARILVGHGLDRDLECLGLEYPAHLIRYDIQTGIQDPYEDCVATMRLYKRMRSQAHPTEEGPPSSSETQHRNNFAAWKQKELEKMTPDALLEISRSDYYCWCLDSKQGMDY
ncbi:RNA exonuclease 4-like protein [Cinnamomum micranthum f. kanehirae]|uniref:RNA exonuclease 4-like protein n=1 Tax=Cinnamomum micranthum f. kanehirae TaxID=337451 RepID=A0A3S3PMK1_9MAGN|nr:RNA exonuclease 4-like protein [Cinnamomum micranthum f. kanehirae]